MIFKKTAILGLGLLGGSLSRALKENNKDYYIAAFGRSPQKLQQPLKEGYIDFAGAIDDLNPGDYDLIVVATPVETSIELICNILNDDRLKNDTLVMDVGSVKDSIIEAVKKQKRASQFIGCHPMAGSEKSGFDHSSFDLYEDSTVILTPIEANRKNDIEHIREFWQAIGAKVIEINSALHDDILVYSSHLPHFISSVLADSCRRFVDKNNVKDIEDFMGRGFLDTTRIAAASPGMWSEIFSLNKDNLIQSIDEFSIILEEMRSLLGKGDEKALQEHLENVKNFREELSD